MWNQFPQNRKYRENLTSKEEEKMLVSTDGIEFNGDINKLDQEGHKEVMKLFCDTPGNELDAECRRYMAAYSQRYGMCGEVLIAAISEYVLKKYEPVMG
jgi:hypothetical protein